MNHDNKQKSHRQEFRVIVTVGDLDSERTFYEEVFNWPIIDDWGNGVMYNTGAAVLELNHDPAAQELNTACRIAISVPDVSSLYHQLKDRATVLSPLQDYSWGDTSFRILDPAGLSVTIFSRTTEAN